MESRVQFLVESYQRLFNMVFDSAFLNTQHYKVRIKGKLERLSVVANEKGAFSSSLDYTNLTFIIIYKLFLYFELFKKCHLFLLVSKQNSHYV